MKKVVLPNYKYRGARAMVLLHEKELNHLFDVWFIAKKNNIALPSTDDPDYESLDTLLVHIFRAARNYLTWIAEKLNWNEPVLPTLPPQEKLLTESKQFLNDLSNIWKETLKQLTEEDAEKVFKSRWGVDYSIDAMLEHAVMHPIRHRFQIEEWFESHQN